MHEPSAPIEDVDAVDLATGDEREPLIGTVVDFIPSHERERSGPSQSMSIFAAESIYGRSFRVTCAETASQRPFRRAQTSV